MVNAGHIEDIARGSFGPKRTQTFEQSAKTFEASCQGSYHHVGMQSDHTVHLPIHEID